MMDTRRPNKESLERGLEGVESKRQRAAALQDAPRERGVGRSTDGFWRRPSAAFVRLALATA